MIRNSSLIAVALLLAYHFSYPGIPKKFYRLNGLQRTTYDRAQKYVFGSGVEQHVIVGSSMSWELNSRILGSDWRKLTFPGCSILTALEIMRRSDKYPAVLLIETNQCFWDANEDLLNDLFNPATAPLRRHSRIFLEEGRPSNFVAGLAEACVRDTCRLGTGLLGKGGSTAQANPEAGLSPELFAQVVALQQEEFASLVPPAPLHERIHRMGQYVDEFRRTGGICILFEMPIDSTLTDLRMPVTVRTAMREHFPANRDHWLTFDLTHHCRTRDGIHLELSEAGRLTELMFQQVNQRVGQSVPL